MKIKDIPTAGENQDIIVKAHELLKRDKEAYTSIKDAFIKSLNVKQREMRNALIMLEHNIKVLSKLES